MNPETETHDVESVITPAVAELIALGACVAANSENAFQKHHYRSVQAGLSREDMIQAVNIALRVKAAPHQEIMDMAQAFLVGPNPEGGCGCSCGEDNGDCEACGCEGGCGDEGCNCG